MLVQALMNKKRFQVGVVRDGFLFVSIRGFLVIQDVVNGFPWEGLVVARLPVFDFECRLCGADGEWSWSLASSIISPHIQ